MSDPIQSETLRKLGIRNPAHVAALVARCDGSYPKPKVAAPERPLTQREIYKLDYDAKFRARKLLEKQQSKPTTPTKTTKP